jgi:p21-activated kinase 1
MPPTAQQQSSPPKRTSMQPTRPAPSPPMSSQFSPNGSPVRRSPSSPYPSRSESSSRPIITTIQSQQPISELIPQRPAPRPPLDGVRSKGHSSSHSLSSINSPSPKPFAPPGPRPPGPPTTGEAIPVTPPMQTNPDFSNVQQSSRFPSNGGPATPKHRSRGSDPRKSDGATSRASPRGNSDDYSSGGKDKSIFGKFVSGMAKGLSSNSSKSYRPEISTPYDPVHLTHVGFNYHTGEFTVHTPHAILMTGITPGMAKVVGKQWCLTKGTRTKSSSSNGHCRILL